MLGKRILIVKGTIKGQGSPYYEVSKIIELGVAEEINYEALEKLEYVNKSFKKDDFDNIIWEGDFQYVEIIPEKEYKKLMELYSSIEEYIKEKYNGWGF